MNLHVVIITFGLCISTAMALSNDTVTKVYMEKLFSKYGRNGYLSLEGLEHLLSSIGLGDMQFDHETGQHYKEDKKFVDFHENHDHQRSHDSDESHDSHDSHDSHEDSHDLDDHSHDSHDDSHNSDDHSHDSNDHSYDSHEDSNNAMSSSECLPPKSLFSIALGSLSAPIDPEAFKQLCPILIQQLDLHTCSQPKVHLYLHELEDSAEWTQGQKWGYSILSCFLLSLLSLLGAPLIPMMHRVFYNHMLQFMVALAIGTLSADALLHLIPHALTPHNHSSSEPHAEGSTRLRGVWLGLMSLSGMYLFFLVERFMGVFTTWKRDKKQKVAKESENTDVEKEGNDESQTHHKKESHSCEGLTLVVHTSKDVRTIANEAHEEVHGHCHTDSPEGFIHSQSNGYHGHSHHDNKVPSSIAAVAWMVIVGDGVHNFSDGLAIGAAFSESMSSGLSTSIAVFCHELPHELGDFAVLLMAGMTVKQALFYNFVSAMMSLLGNIIGVALGNLANITPWILCLIAGMFLYVALVDMLPELTNMTSKKGESAVFHLVLQNLGLITGGSIMLLIAVFEEQIHF